MSFTYTAFPELRLKHGVEKTINDPVSITTNGNREVRRKVNKQERYSWKIPSRNLYQEDMEEIVNFFVASQSSVNSFLYRDPTLPELVNQRFTPITISGAPVFALFHTGQHPVMNLGRTGNLPAWDFALSTIVIKRNGVVQTVDTNFAVLENYDLSLYGYPRTMVIVPTSTWSSTDVVTFSGPLYHTVRFDSMINYSITAMEKSNLLTGTCEVVPTISQLGDVSLIEVFEYTNAD